MLQCLKHLNTNRCLSSSSTTTTSTIVRIPSKLDKKQIDETYNISREKFADSRNKRLANMLRKSAKKEEKVLSNAVDNIRLNELKTLVEGKGFVIVDEELHDNVILKKKLNDIDIVIEFNSIDSR
jgi:hypothetical protein